MFPTQHECSINYIKVYLFSIFLSFFCNTSYCWSRSGELFKFCVSKSHRFHVFPLFFSYDFLVSVLLVSFTLSHCYYLTMLLSHCYAIIQVLFYSMITLEYCFLDDNSLVSSFELNWIFFWRYNGRFSTLCTFLMVKKFTISVYSTVLFFTFVFSALVIFKQTRL